MASHAKMRAKVQKNAYMQVFQRFLAQNVCFAGVLQGKGAEMGGKMAMEGCFERGFCRSLGWVGAVAGKILKIGLFLSFALPSKFLRSSFERKSQQTKR